MSTMPNRYLPVLVVLSRVYAFLTFYEKCTSCLRVIEPNLHALLHAHASAISTYVLFIKIFKQVEIINYFL